MLIYASMAIRLVGEPFGLALQALGNMAWRSVVNVLWEAVTVGLGFLILMRGGSVDDLAMTIIIANGVEVLINLAYFVFVSPINFAVGRSGLRLVLFGGLPFFLWVFLQTIYQQTGSLTLAEFGGEVAVGWYGAAVQFIAPLYSIPAVAIMVLLPQFSQIQLVSDAEFKAAVTRALNYIILITLPAALGLCALADRVIALFNYPDTFQHSIPVLRLLAFSLPFTSITMIIATGVSAMKKERTWAYVSFFSLISLVILNVALIPLARDMLGNAAIGGAAGLIGAELVTILAAVYLFGHSMIEPAFLRTLGKMCLASAVMVGVVLATASFVLPVPILAGVATYGGAALMMGVLPEDDVQALRKMLDR
jgi:O-antigen/teichoic acid export membrane protein